MALTNSTNIIISDLILDMEIGLYESEYHHTQKVKININLEVINQTWRDDMVHEMTCYHTLIKDIQALSQKGHIQLAETLAEEIAAICLARKEVLHARIRVEKLETDNPVRGVGIEITRTQDIKNV